MDGKLTGKIKRENRLCWFLCFIVIFIMSLVIITLLALIMRDVRDHTKPGTDTTNIMSCENEQEIRLLEFNRTFKQSLLHLCNVTCSRRAQDTYIAGEFFVLRNDTPAQRARCMACCPQLSREDCNKTSLDDGFPHPDCIWMETEDGGGGCISNLPLKVSVPGNK